MTLAAQLHDLLSAPAYALPVVQHADLCAWLCGLPEGAAGDVTELSAGDRAAALDRLTRERHPRSLVDAWVVARARAVLARGFTVEQVAAEGAG